MAGGACSSPSPASSSSTTCSLTGPTYRTKFGRRLRTVVAAVPVVERAGTGPLPLPSGAAPVGHVLLARLPRRGSACVRVADKLLLHPVAYPLWFLQTLIVCFALSPLLYWPARVLRWLAPAPFALMWMLGRHVDELERLEGPRVLHPRRRHRPRAAAGRDAHAAALVRQAAVPSLGAGMRAVHRVPARRGHPVGTQPAQGADVHGRGRRVVRLRGVPAAARGQAPGEAACCRSPSSSSSPRSRC